MEKWRYKSLEWIHKVREENYRQTKDISPTELIKKTRKTAEKNVTGMGLKVISKKVASTR